MWTIFKAFVTMFFLFYVVFLGLGGMWGFSFPMRDQICTPAWEGVS